MMKMLSLFLVCLAFFCGFEQTNCSSVSNKKERNNYEVKEVPLYDSLFNEYYFYVKEQNNHYSKSFDDFKNDYYCYQIPIKEYCNNLIYNISYSNNRTMLKGNNKNVYTIKSLENVKCRHINDFLRLPDTSDFLLKKLHIGDIVYETYTGLGVGHMAMITSTDSYILDKENKIISQYIETIEACPEISNSSGKGVTYGYLDENRILEKQVKILRVVDERGLSLLKDDLLKFVIKQIGKDYKPNYLTVNTSIDSSEWFCSELVWAAYKYVNIDISELNGETYEMHHNIPVPRLIFLSDNTNELTIDFDMMFLNVDLDYKKSGIYYISIKNNGSVPKLVFYNFKLCLQKDVLNKNKLYDLKKINILPNETIQVQVISNWLSNSFSCFYENYSGDYMFSCIVRIDTSCDKYNKQVRK